MILRTLGYYDDFVCMGGACRNSCCIGWELDIDEATCDYYMSLAGPFGDRLRAHMAEGSFREEDCRTFCLTIDGRCPFLNREGLCDIVLTLGPEALCEICSEYPRYTFELGDAVEKSLTISCEEAARLMFTRTRPLPVTETPLAGEEASGAAGDISAEETLSAAQHFLAEETSGEAGHLSAEEVLGEAGHLSAEEVLGEAWHLSAEEVLGEAGHLSAEETLSAAQHSLAEEASGEAGPSSAEEENEDIAGEITLLRGRLIAILQDRTMPLKDRVVRAVRLTEKAQALINRAGLLDKPLMERLRELIDEEAGSSLEGAGRGCENGSGGLEEPVRLAALGGCEGMGKPEGEPVRPAALGGSEGLEEPEGEPVRPAALGGSEGPEEPAEDAADGGNALEALKSPRAAMEARLELFSGCEVLSDEWTEACERVRLAFSEREPVWEHYMAELFYPRQADYEHLLVYFVFRYFPRAAYDYDAAGKLAFAVLMTLVVRDLDWAAFVENGGRLGIADRIRSAGIVSREVEHSDYNLDTLFEDIAFDRHFQGEALTGQL